MERILSKISVVIPVYNERRTVLQAIKNVAEVNLGEIEKELIIVDDGSTDGSAELLKLLEQKMLEGHKFDGNLASFFTAPERPQSAPLDFKFIFQKHNHGKGLAVKMGFEVAKGDIVIIQDADLEYNPRDYIRLLSPILAGNADVVYGSRFVTAAPRRVLYFGHYIANRFVTFLSNLFTGLNLSDMETCYKVFTKEARKLITPHLKSKRFGIEPELTALSAKAGFRVYEVGISYSGRTYSDGKKISWKDGLASIWHIIRHNLFRGSKKFKKSEQLLSQDENQAGSDQANPILFQVPRNSESSTKTMRKILPSEDSSDVLNFKTKTSFFNKNLLKVALLVLVPLFIWVVSLLFFFSNY